MLLVHPLLRAADLANVAVKPNIVFILADDLGWSDLGCYGSKFYETPNIDRLAREGGRFTQAYTASSVCSPTRAAILTGKHPARLHLTDWLPGRPDRPDQKLRRPDIQDFLPLEEFTVAEALKESGYRTGFIGKWHLGESAAYHPEHQGFDLNIGGCKLGHPPSYFSPYGIPTITDGPKGEYLTERLTDEAEKFIEQSVQAKEPFFLYLSHYAPHNPLQGKPELVAKYEAKAAQMPAADRPEFTTDRGHKTRQVQNNAAFAAMVESLDDSVGRVLAKLKDLGIEGNTLVIFTSDNGGISTAEEWPTSNYPLRAGKGWPYEGGVRVPFIARWPGVVRPDSTSNERVNSMDFYPTFLQVAGVPMRPEQHLDGGSLMTVLQGGALPERPIFWHYPHYSNQGGDPDSAVRVGDFKLVEYIEDNTVELYNLKDDPGERNDLAQAMPEKTDELRHLLHQWRFDVAAQMPSPNPNYDPNWQPTQQKKPAPPPED